MARKRSPVHNEMGSKVPSMTGSKGIYDHDPCPQFSKPHDLGGGGIPTKFMEDIPFRKAESLRPTQTAGLESRAPRPGTTQRPFGKTDE